MIPHDREPATKDSWNAEPRGATVTNPYEATFVASNYHRIRMGLIPQAIEDKWFAYLENDTLYLYRSWTGQFQYAVTFERI